MTIAHRFDYVRASGVADVVEILVARGGGARVLAGGTDLVPWLRDDAAHPDLLVDVKHIPELAGIGVEDGTLRIGALATFTDLLESDAVARHTPALAEAARTVASVGIRNRATLAGNICSAVPSCDGGPPLLVHEASVHAVGPAGERSIPITGWFTGPRSTALGPGEVVTHLSVPPPGEHGGAYLKLARYRGEDLAQAAVAVLILPRNRYRVAFGAVGPVPFRAREIEARLAGRDLDDAVVEEVEGMVGEAISPISDVRASAEYRAHMCRVMLGRALRAAAGRLRGRGPGYGSDLLWGTGT